MTAGPGDLRDGGLITLLALNGPRHRPDRTMHCAGRALDLYIGDRTMGPIILDVEGGRMDRYCAGRMV